LYIFIVCIIRPDSIISAANSSNSLKRSFVSGE
jgi:hypothetical protein